MLVAYDTDMAHDDLALRHRRQVLQRIVYARVLEHFPDLCGRNLRMFARHFLRRLPD